MGFRLYLAAGCLVLTSCDGGNVTTTSTNEQVVNVNTDDDEASCELLCVGKGQSVEVTEVCDGEVQSVSEVPLTMLPAKCRVVAESPSEAPAPAVENESPELAEPAEDGARFS